MREFNTDTSFFLKFALPVGERRFEGHVLCSLLIPVYCGRDSHTTRIGYSVADTYLASKRRSTISRLANRTE